MRVSTELGNLGYNTGAYKVLHNSNSNKGIVKFDWNINDNHKLAVIYNFLDASKINLHTKCFGFRGPNASILQFENQDTKSIIRFILSRVKLKIQ
jgi:hypothetical protein